ncbi:PBSX family phage terminase large subunit [Lentilactobacillus kosonis]|uniref:Phage terminase, large subunit n=1 Tax=Lentilactobacillus kosonis TaxID=2810561 RepID=A0A401FPM5_9LACO|nr:PBSX family phage terminase large subunit [Lentilactobacillus kosonis]GAY74266.1 phage terminase, large subunit [Lentilactobacillus kosonis]
MKATAMNNLFTAKQVHVLDQELNNPDWRLMINYGAVRAGKTFVDNFVFLYEVRHAAEVAKRLGKKHPQYILAGVSSKSIEDNILTEIMETFGLSFKFDQYGSFKITFPHLPGVKVVKIHTGSISGLGAVRGMTAYGAYVNEASLANEQVFNEIRNRCNMPGARVVCDTNPDVPTHWLKVKYIDNPNNSKTIISNHFVIDDNTFLDPAYVQALKSDTPSGMFSDRALRGLWVAGEGLVYADFDKSKNIIKLDDYDHIKNERHLTYYAGVDWGFEHKGVIVVMADDEDGNTYLIEEHTRQHKDIDYWVKVAKEYRVKYGWNMPFYADSARPEYVDRFRNENLNVFNAYKIRLTGVEVIATLIKTGHFLCLDSVVDDDKSKFLDELYQYIWDEKSGEPVKENDDVMDSIRYAKATKQWYEKHHEEDNFEQQDTILSNSGVISFETSEDDNPWNMDLR